MVEGNTRWGRVAEECIGDKEEPRERYIPFVLVRQKRQRLLLSFPAVSRDRGDA